MDCHARSDRRAASARWVAAGALIALWAAGCRVGDLLSPGVSSATGNPPSTPAERLAFVRQPAGATARTPIDPPIEVAALDGEGQPVIGFTGTVTLAIEENPADATLSGTTTVRARDGVATFTGVLVSHAGDGYRLTATAAGLPPARSDRFDVRPPRGVPARLVQVNGDGQQDTVGATLGASYLVRVVDGFDDPVPGVTVRWEAEPGSGTVVPGVVVTGAAGQAAARHTLGTTPGDQQVRAWVHGDEGLAVTFTATATHGAPARLAFTVQPSDVKQDRRIQPPVEVTIYDRLGNVATGTRVDVRMSLVAFGTFARLRGGTERPADDGVAVFDDLRVDQSGTGFRLRASMGPLTADSDPFTVRR